MGRWVSLERHVNSLSTGESAGVIDSVQHSEQFLNLGGVATSTIPTRTSQLCCLFTVLSLYHSRVLESIPNQGRSKNQRNTTGNGFAINFSYKNRSKRKSHVRNDASAPSDNRQKVRRFGTSSWKHTPGGADIASELPPNSGYRWNSDSEIIWNGGIEEFLRSRTCYSSATHIWRYRSLGAL